MTSRGRVQPCDKPQAASSATSRVRVSCFTACTALFTALMSCSSNGFQAWLCGSFSHCWSTTCRLSQTACCTLEVVNGENSRICQNSFTFCIQLEIMFALFLFAFCLHYNYKHDARVCTLNSGFWQLRAGDQAQMRSHSSLRTPIVQINNYQIEVITTVTACRKGRLETCKLLRKQRRSFGAIAPFAVRCCAKEAAALRYCLIGVLAPELVRRSTANGGLPLPSSLSPTNPGHI